MSIHTRMIILSLSVVIHYCLTKTSDLTFIRCHNVRLEKYQMVVTKSVRAPSCNENVCAWALTFSYHIHYVNSYLRCHFFIDGYGFFPSLHRTISYQWTMYAYNLCIKLYFSFVSTIYPFLTPTVSTLVLILPYSISTLD